MSPELQARSLVSATCFTVLGVANKMATVTANVLIWDQHASAFGIASLVVCLIGAAIYEQSPMRAEKVAESKPDKVEPEVRPIAILSHLEQRHVECHLERQFDCRHGPRFCARHLRARLSGERTRLGPRRLAVGPGLDVIHERASFAAAAALDRGGDRLPRGAKPRGHDRGARRRVPPRAVRPGRGSECRDRRLVQLSTLESSWAGERRRPLDRDRREDYGHAKRSNPEIAVITAASSRA